MLKERSRTIIYILQALDVFAILAGGMLAFYYKFQSFSMPATYVNALLMSAICTFFVFPFSHIYESMRGQSFWGTAKKLIQAVFMVLILLTGTAFITKTGAEYSREWCISWAFIAFILLVLCRGSLMMVLRFMRSHGWNERRVVIFGSNDLAERLVKTIQMAGWTGFKVLALFDDQSVSKVIEGITVEKIPADLNAYMDAHKSNMDEIWIALPLCEEERVKKILYDLRHHTIMIRYVLDIFGLGLLNHSVTDLAGLPAINLNTTPMVGINRMIKAIEDRLAAAIILVLISPLVLLIAMSIKLTSKGPVFFKQHRHGWDGLIIKIYKFRTMIQHAEEA